MNVGSLFSGIEGFGLGLERAGMRVVWHCESDDFCQRVIRKHWPDNPVYPDVRELRGADVAPVDVLCAGWPCPGFSVAGRGEGFDHPGSGLWTEIVRLVRELRPSYVVLENASALLARGFGRVLGDLAESGYDTEWDCLPASAFGAPHQRNRLWLVANPAGVGCGSWRPRGSAGRDSGAPNTALRTAGRAPTPVRWPDEPDLPRVVDGVPDWVDRMRATGNALVPQIAEWIGRRIIEWEEGVAA